MQDKTLEVRAELPDSEAAAAEPKRKNGVRRVLMATVCMLIAAVAAAIVMAYFWMPVLQIYGKSMSPTLKEESIVVSVKDGKIERGDVIAFYLNNKILVKRVIGVGGDQITIADNGDVSVNGEKQDEPYVTRKHSGGPNVQMPYQVADGELFVIGDNREKSVDSRHREVGCVTEEQILGRVLLQIWPLSEFGLVK